MQQGQENPQRACACCEDADSEAGTRLFKESGFFGRTLPAEYRVSMRKAPETGNDVPVADRKSQEPVEGFFRFIRHIRLQLLEQVHGLFLVGDGLGVLERQVKEHSFYRPQSLVSLQCQAFL